MQPTVDDVERETRQAQAVMRAAEFHVRDVALVILTLLAVLYTLYFAADIILPFVLALVLALLLSPATRFLCDRLRLPRMLAAVLLILVLFSAIGGVGYAISVPATGWIAKAPQSLPTLQKKLGFLRQPITLFEHGMQQMQTLMRDGGHSGGGGGEEGAKPAAAQPAAASQGSSPGVGVGLSVLAGTRSFLGQALTLIIVLFFLLADGDALLRRFVEILPGLTEKKRAVQIATEVERNISGYLATITFMNALVGVANGLSVWLFGLPDPLLWGTAAFLLNYVPILGPLTGMVIFFFVGLFSFSSPLWALAPAGVYFLIHVMEGETVTPMLLARRFTLNPLLVIVALMFWDWLWGIPGALLAVPLLAVFKILCDNFESLTPIGHLLGAEPTKRRRDVALLHASCAALGDAAVLLIGPSASGKSDLLLRLIDRGFKLVADDQVRVEGRRASAPEPLAGLLEVRGLGLLRLEFVASAELALVVRLERGERLPSPARYADLDLPMISLEPFPASAALQVELALEAAQGRGSFVTGAFG